MKKYIALSFMCLSFVALSACSNTLDGAGRDIENAGKKIQQEF